MKVKTYDLSFDEVINNCDAMICITGKDANLMFANKALLSYFQIKPAEIANKKWLNVIHSDDRTTITEALAADTTEKRITHIRCFGLSERTRWMKLSLQKDGENVIVTWTEIHDNVLHQHRAFKTRNFLKNFVAQSSDPALIVSKKGNIFYANESFTNFSGFEFSTLDSANITKFFPLQNSILSLLHERTHKISLYTFLKKNKDRTNVSIELTPVMEEANTTFYMVTVRPQTDNSVMMNEDFEKYSPALFWIADRDGKLIHLSRNWEAVTGIPLGRIMKSGFDQVIHEDDVDDIIKAWNDSLLSKEPLCAHFRLKTDSECDYKWFQVRARFVEDKKRDLSNWVGAALDINEIKTKQFQLSDLISVATHELRTPLTSIKAYTQLLSQEIEHPFLEKTEKCVNKLVDLINELLDSSRIENGRFQYFMCSFEFNPFVKEIVENFQKTLDKHTIIISGSTDKKVFADKLRIEQVLCNFLSNAVKYSPDNNEIQLTIGEDRDNVKLSVKDGGIGIPERAQEKIFSRFYRVDTGNKNLPGMGIGLYISSEIIKYHEGQIGFNSIHGKGSEFYFSLPAAS